MWEMKCQKCGSGIKWWPSELFHPGSTRDCVDCGERLELTNPAVCTIINSFIFSGIMVGMSFIGLGWQWMRAMTAGIVCWLILPFIVNIFGRWRSMPRAEVKSYVTRRWLAIGMVGGWVFGIAVAFTVISFGLIYRDIIMDISSTYAGPGTDAIEEFISRTKFILPIGIGISFAALGVCAIARIKRLRLIDVNKHSE